MEVLQSVKEEVEAASEDNSLSEESIDSDSKSEYKVKSSKRSPIRRSPRRSPHR
jgi:hypothetical protein